MEEQQKKLLKMLPGVDSVLELAEDVPDADNIPIIRLFEYFR